MLLSFAQFEREVSGERIRDKIAASKARGMWLGGVAPVGYKINNRQLEVNEDEVPVARHIYERYLTLGSVHLLKQELDRKGIKSPARISLKGKAYGGMNLSRGALYAILKNPAYAGKISHKGKIHEGLHDGIISVETWERVQTKLKEQSVARTEATKRNTLLQGLIYDRDGNLYGPTYTCRHNRQYCYYVSHVSTGKQDGVATRLPAHGLERVIEKALRQDVKRLMGAGNDSALEYVLARHDRIPADDLIRGCIERVTIGPNQITLKVNPTKFHTLVKNHLGVKIEADQDVFEMTVPFKMGKAWRGELVIAPEKKDIFSMPPHKLKKLIQGMVWRDEHFDGLTLKDIAVRERCSEGYVGTAIFTAFEFPHSV